MLEEQETPLSSSEIAHSENFSIMVDIAHQAHETLEYFSLKRMLKKSYYQNHGFLTKFIKTKCELFNRPSANDLSPFEKILTTNEDKSAQISLILRTFGLWNDKDFWTKIVNLQEVMRHYSTNGDANVKNFFSLLLYDWHSPNEETTNHQLCEKFDAYAATGESLFSKLFSIIDDPQYRGYNSICLRIIYQFLYEKSEKLATIGNFYEQTQFQDVIAHAIDDALNMKNQEFKVHVLKILTVVLDNTSDEIYLNLKGKILDYVSYNFEYTSAYRISLNCIEKHCDEKFFNLAFLLKENRLKKFEFEFEEFIKIYRKFYGEYSKVAIKQNARLLYHICEERCEKKLLKTVEFIFQKCEFIELNSTILTTFEEVSEFYTIFNEPLNQEEEKFLSYAEEFFDNEFSSCTDKLGSKYSIDEFLSNCIENKKLTRKLLFGRRNVNEISLFEKILLTSDLYPILGNIWVKFHLFTKPEILNLRNHRGKSLLYYINQAGINQIVTFLNIPLNYKSEDFNKSKYYMVLQNSHICALAGKSLIEYQLDIFLEKKKLESGDDLFGRLVYLFEEIGTIEEIKIDAVIDYFVILMNKTDKYARELFEIDDLIGIIVLYWTPNKGEYSRYKDILIKINPFFDLLFMIIEKKDEEFFKTFPSKFKLLEEVYETRYKVSLFQKDNEDHEYERYSSNFMFILFLAAIRTNQHKIIDFIFRNDWFVTINFSFPENVKSSEIHYYAALNLLKHGNELGRANIPEDWITKGVLEEFLDSKIRYRDKDYIEIDCTSFIHAESQKLKVKGKADVTEKILMLEDTFSLEFIKSRENFKKLFDHPVVETYIELKHYKYKRIFVYNFWAFVLLYTLPFLSLIYHNHNKELKGVDEFLCTYLHYIGIAFLILRESFQCIIFGSFDAYFKDRSNIFDISLIALSIALSICSTLRWDSDEKISKHLLNFLEVALILFTTISATSLLPFSYVPINMQILKKVSLTFMKIFFTFSIILIAFALSFCIIFENQLDNHNKTATDDMDEIEIEQENTMQNFKYLHTSFVKIIMMLSGEYSIEPFTISIFQLTFFVGFVICSVILFNILLGLSIEDVQKLKEGSRKFNLLSKVKKLIQMGDYISELHILISDYLEDKDYPVRKLDRIKYWIVRSLFIITKPLLSKYHLLHIIRKIYVNINTKEVFVYVNRKYEHILSADFPVLTRIKRFILGRKKNDIFRISEIASQEIERILDEKDQKMLKTVKKMLRGEELL